MREVNLISVIDAFTGLKQETFRSFLNYHFIKIKEDELKDLGVLIEHLKTLSLNPSVYDKFFVGYSIPQIGKEFDLLRIDDDSVVNIELKRMNTNEKIKKQLFRNKYYLSFLKKETHVFSYVAEDKKIYSLDDNNNLVELGIRQLLAALASQRVEKISNIDSYFNPSNYLVSPFNSTQEFIKGKYFLTAQQEEIKNVAQLRFGDPNYIIVAIKGKAGTGKTLLTYDIAKEVYKSKEVLIIHCGILNSGHVTLRDRYGWDIIPIKYVYGKDYSKFHLIVIDEAQRIHKYQLDFIIGEVKKFSANCILSYDGQQTLRKGEISANIAAEIETAATIKPFELTTKIRTNKEVASFIHCLFNKNEPTDKFAYSNIDLSYFDNIEDAKLFLSQLREGNWKIINYTPSTKTVLPYDQYNVQEETDNAHTVIGQEFDNVVAIIDSHFYYKKNKLSTQSYKKRPYYHPTKMLFQIVSRTRIRLKVIIIKNEEILERCLQILQHH